MKVKFYLGIMLFLAFTVFSGCADVEVVADCTVGHTYGFWGSLWHGIVAPISFIASLFSDEIALYAHNNNGGWYDFGFILGIGGLGFPWWSKSNKRNN